MTTTDIASHNLIKLQLQKLPTFFLNSQMNYGTKSTGEMKDCNFFQPASDCRSLRKQQEQSQMLLPVTADMISHHDPQFLLTNISP